jgi:hypothetical protein
MVMLRAAVVNLLRSVRLSSIGKWLQAVIIDIAALVAMA